MRYIVGRTLQAVGLVTMPAAIWIGHFYRDEHNAILVFVGSATIFYLGTLLIRR